MTTVTQDTFTSSKPLFYRLFKLYKDIKLQIGLSREYTGKIERAFALSTTKRLIEVEIELTQLFINQKCTTFQYFMENNFKMTILLYSAALKRAIEGEFEDINDKLEQIKTMGCRVLKLVKASSPLPKSTINPPKNNIAGKNTAPPNIYQIPPIDLSPPEEEKKSPWTPNSSPHRNLVSHKTLNSYSHGNNNRGNINSALGNINSSSGGNRSSLSPSPSATHIIKAQSSPNQASLQIRRNSFNSAPASSTDLHQKYSSSSPRSSKSPRNSKERGINNSAPPSPEKSLVSQDSSDSLKSLCVSPTLIANRKKKSKSRVDAIPIPKSYSSESFLMDWQCTECTVWNLGNVEECMMCKAEKKQKLTSKSKKGTPRATRKWNCLICSEANLITTAVCTICGYTRGTENDYYKWSCYICFAPNQPNFDRCYMCGSVKQSST